MRPLRFADLFCGAGGTTAGAEASGAARAVCAVDHWAVAVETHRRNFPDCLHINSRLADARPAECPAIDLLFASPECTHHSRARGGRPTSDQQRAGAWDLLPWVEHHRPTWIVVENVREFRDWGPVGSDGRPLASKRGRLFDAWTTALRACGYVLDHRLLNAADYGAATSRERLFVVARKGNRAPRWPEPTHARRAGGELPGLGLRPWRAAAEIVDWSIPCRSVFLRAAPLVDKTLARIEAGLRRFVEPFVVTLRRGNANHGTDEPLATVTSHAIQALAVPFQFSPQSLGAPKRLEEPVPTLTTTNRPLLAVPFLASVNHGDHGDRHGRTAPLDAPLRTVTASRSAAPAVPFLVPRQGHYESHVPKRCRGVDEPLNTITASHVPGAVVVPFVVSYYGTGDATDVRRPLGTVATRDRRGLVQALVETAPAIAPRSAGERSLLATMQELGVADVGFRMLSNPELAAAQGFSADYLFAGTKTDVTRQIGNAVCPPVAEAIVRALAG
jgi:DNA (cytosine-5)-methyltransferase 1